MARRLLSGKLTSNRGYTITEILTVLVIVGLLFSLAVPMVTNGTQRAREATLRHNLTTIRTALDDYFADHMAYPTQLEELVDTQYLRQLPKDTISNQTTEWRLIVSEEGQIEDIKSRSNDKSSDGEPYANW